MRKIILLSIVSYFFYGCQTDTTPYQDSQLTIQGNLRVLVVEGTPYDRGFQHGSLLKTDIHELVNIWKNDLSDTYQMPADSFIAAFVAGTDFISAIQAHTPNLLEELRGIADGAEIDFTTMYAYQLVDEVWVLGRQIVENRCTSFGVQKTENNPTYTAQNLDIPFFHGYQTLLYVKDPSANLESFVLTFPGFIGANGMNNRPVSVVVNALMQLKPATDGLPVAFVVRGVLEKDTYTNAVDFLHNIKHAAGQNYIIGSVEQMASYECSESEVTEFVPFENAYFTYHTNHPLTNDNYTDGFLAYLQNEGMTLEEYNARCHRFNSMQANYPDNSSVFDVEELKSIFQNRDWGINNRSSFACTIMVLSDHPEFHITGGRPDEEPFQVFTFN